MKKLTEFQKFKRETGLSTQAIATKAGLNYMTVARWSSGRTNPNADKRAHLGWAFPHSVYGRAGAFGKTVA